MSLSQTYRTIVTDSTGSTQQDTVTIVGDTEMNLSVALNTGETAVERLCLLPVSTLVLKALYIKADVAVSALGFYNDVPAQVGTDMALSAGVPLIWNEGGGDCPILDTSDIVTLKHTNNAIGTLQIRALFGIT